MARVLILGAWGALHTVGWDRQLSAIGPVAKATRQIVNHDRIYQPRSGRRGNLFAAAAPKVHAPPPVRANPSDPTG
jgi:NADH:ubiquinone reductase (H+-translocating)